MLRFIILGGCVSIGMMLSPVVVQAQARQLEIAPEALPSATANSQITPLELNQFSQVIKQLQALEIKNQKKMTDAIKAEGLKPERFVEIEDSIRDPASQPENPITAEEKEKYIKAATRLQEIWQEAQPKREKAVTTQGLTLQRFAQINQVVSQDPALQKQVQQIVGQ